MQSYRPRHIKKLFESYGFAVKDITRTRHWHITATLNAETKVFVMSCTPSDYRGTKNYEALLKREATRMKGTLC